LSYDPFSKRGHPSEASNIDTKVGYNQEPKDLAKLRNNWQAVWNEVTTIASNLGIHIKLPPGGSLYLRNNVSDGKGKESSQEAYYRTFIFYAIIDNVIGGLTVRCNAVKERFDVLWHYLDHSAAVTDQKARILAAQCCKRVDEESFVTEMRHLLFVHSVNFGKEKLLPLDLLNTIYDFKPQERSPIVCIGLTMLLTIPATVASAERSLASLN